MSDQGHPVRDSASADGAPASSPQHRSTERLKALAKLAHAVTLAPELSEALRTLTEGARRLIGAHQAVTSLAQQPNGSPAVHTRALSEHYAHWRHDDVTPEGSDLYSWASQANRPVRLTQAELEAHPLWRAERAWTHPPLRGWLAAPLIAHDGRPLGLMQLSDKLDGTEFDEEDEAILVQLAQFASAALERARIEQALREETRTLEMLNAIGQTVAAELNLERAVQKVTDAATELTGAAFGAFFYNVIDPGGEKYTLYTLSGAPREAFSRFPMPRNTAVFAPTFQGEGVVRSSDITQDPRYGRSPPHHGMPKGHLPVRSYLAVPVVSRSGEVLGGLFFGHPEPGVFSERAERIAVGIAAQAAIAIDNARLYQAARNEIAERTRAEAALRESERRLNAVLDNATVAVFLMNDRQQCVYMNAAAEKLTGYSLAETFGRPLHDVIHHTRPDGTPYPLAECPIDRAFPQNNQQQGEEVFVHRDGSFYPVAFTASPIRDETAQVIGTIIEVRDIRAAKQAATEREQLLQSERAARSEAERLGRMKDEFLATLSHELRTPLNAILGWATLLRRLDPANPDHDKGLETIERNARVQAQIIDDLLDMSRIISGKVQLDVQSVNLHEIITAAVDSIRPAIEAKKLRLRTTLDAKLGPIKGDPHRLQQVLWNLLNNAVKFTPAGGRIHVLLERVNSHVEICVEDSGIGIRPEFLPFVFDRFRQADASTTRRHGGLGLGLSIVKHLVELHGGSVRVKSPGEGQGSTFIVALPISVIRLEESGRRERPLLAEVDLSSVQLPSLAGRTALVVDDEPDARVLIARLIEERGGRTIMAGSAEEALDVLGREAVDILVSDVGMPELDGYELIQRLRLRGHDRVRNIPAIALTAYARADDRQRALLAGYQLHLSKPVEPRELIAGMASLLNVPHRLQSS